MEFALLGPLEVRGSDGPIEVGRGRPRRLLITLLLRVGRVVPTDVLIDQVWGDRAPADAANALQGQVSYLRRALGLSPTGGGPALRTAAGGYQLDVCPEAVDMVRFERLVASARERLTAGSVDEVEAALADLRDALDLWRGEPLQEFADQPFVVPEVERLRELQSAAREYEVEARLLLGRHEKVVPVLRRLIADYPLREHLRAQLVLALYRCGRQADALRAYTAARDILVDELGVEPGHELQRLHQMVLAQDPQLEWSPMSATVARRAPRAGTEPLAHNLPWSPTALIGRDADVCTVAELLADRVRLVTLIGPPGVGKTRLAVAAAQQSLNHFPDGVWFVDLSGVADPALVPTTTADAARVRIDGVDSVTSTLVAHWRGAEALVVLDNCEHLLVACAALVQELMAGCPGVSILATSRQSLHVRGEQQMPIGPLPVPDHEDRSSLEAPTVVASVALLAARLREVDPTFEPTAANVEAMGEVCRRLDGLPLAIELAAPWLRLLTVDQLVARLGSSLDLLRDGPLDLPGRQRTVRDAVRWSYDLLAAAEQAMFRRLSVFAGGATLDAVTAICSAAGALGDDPYNVANRLVAASIVRRDDGDRPRLGMLAVVREFASELLDAATETETTARAHASYFAAMTRAADEKMSGPEARAWVARLADERDNLRAALASSVIVDVDQGLAMAAALWLFWEIRGEREEARSWLERLLSAGDQKTATPARARALRCLGNIDSMQSRTNDATSHYGQSLCIAEQVGDEDAAAHVIGNLGVVCAVRW